MTMQYGGCPRRAMPTQIVLNVTKATRADRPFTYMAIVVFAAIALACGGAGYSIGSSEPAQAQSGTGECGAYEAGTADMQLPELPTGCEATAGATLLRLNGIEVSKTDVANAMPRGDNWIREYLGNPYDDTGFAIMAPGMAYTLNKFVRHGEGVMDLTGRELPNLPTPCEVWVTIGLDAPIPCQERDGYQLVYNTHCVTVLYVGEYAVHVIDPLKGERDYPRALFEQRYKELGKQALYVMKEC